LFGSEKRGLTNEDLSYCHAILRIPASAKAASMNLGQAVAVCCYELRQLLDGSRARNASKNSTAASCAQVGEITRLIDELDPLLGESETSHPGKLRKRKERLRQMLMRWSITSQDLTLLFGIVRDLSWRIRHK
jgi:tRNA/rRNA methyltransferase